MPNWRRQGELLISVKMWKGEREGEEEEDEEEDEEEG